jgi:hypothetical protein
VLYFKNGAKDKPIELDIRPDLLKKASTKQAVQRLEEFLKVNK